MFTAQETQFLIRVVREQGDASTTGHIVDKLERIDDYEITLYCHSCCEGLDPDEFRGNHLCKGCGLRICDQCAEDYGICENPRCTDWERWEAADVLYDRAMDR